MANSDALLAAARGHFDNMRGKSISIPEWGSEGKPLVAFYDPPTLRVRQSVTARAGKSRGREMAMTCILCLKDADGNRLFQDDAATLAALENEVSPQVIARIYADVIGLTPEADLGN